MNISRFFVDKPIFAAVLSIVIFVAGLISIFKLPISEYPDVVPPSIVVRAQYPGANPKIIAETVAAPLEEQINGVENMLYMSSQNTSDGAMALTVTFKIGTNVEQAETQVQNRVQRALPRLPEEVRQIGVTTVKSSPNLTMVVHLQSPNGRYDDLYLRNYAVLNIKDQRRPAVRFGRLRDARLARSAESGTARPDRRRRRRRGARAERAGRRRRDRPGPKPGRGLPVDREYARPFEES
jgi:multidrug efflux pump